MATSVRARNGQPFRCAARPRDRAAVASQAEAIAALLPALMRRLFTGDDALAAELPLAQLRVCGVLCEGPRPMSAVSRDLGVSLSAMTQIADRLERAKLVKRVAPGGDRRVRCLQLTERGQRMMRLRHRARVDRAQAVLERLPPPVRDEVLAALETLKLACTAVTEGDGQAAKADH